MSANYWGIAVAKTIAKAEAEAEADGVAQEPTPPLIAKWGIH